MAHASNVWLVDKRTELGVNEFIHIIINYGKTSSAHMTSFLPVNVDVSVELLQKEAVELPLALCLLLLQQWAVLTGPSSYPEMFNRDTKFYYLLFNEVSISHKIINQIFEKNELLGKKTRHVCEA